MSWAGRIPLGSARVRRMGVTFADQGVYSFVMHLSWPNRCSLGLHLDRAILQSRVCRTSICK